jgi:hypothetical protein
VTNNSQKIDVCVSNELKINWRLTEAKVIVILIVDLKAKRSFFLQINHNRCDLTLMTQKLRQLGAIELQFDTSESKIVMKMRKKS